MKVVTTRVSIHHKWWVWVRTFLAVCLCAPLVSGCWDAKEVEHLFYVHALGVDYHDGNYEVYAQIMSPFALSKESKQSEQNTGSWIGKGVGRTFEEATHDLYATTQRRVYWGHLDTIVLSEELLAKQGFQQTLDIVTRYPETRYTSWIFCTKSPVRKVLSARPILESSPVYSVLGDPYKVYMQSSFIEPMRLNRFIIHQQEPGYPGLIPEMSVVKGKWNGKKESFPEPELSGYGFLRSGKFVGRLSRDEATGMRWFFPSLPRSIVTLKKGGNTIATVTLASSRSRVKPVIVKGRLSFNVQVNVGGTISQLENHLSEAQLESLVAKTIEKDVRKTYHNGLRYGVDIYSLSDTLYRRNPRAFHRFAGKDGRIALGEDSLQRVRVNVSIHDSGRTNEPATRFTS